jgi:eukaryotic-like serine/threonine-protein kinase
MSTLVPGAELGGRYRLARRVADDGLLERWTATDDVLARAVEVDVLVAGGGARDAFAAAATATARLTHPAIVSTYDTGRSADGSPYVVTERPVGPTLADWIDRNGPVPPVRVVHIGRQLAHALDAAHRAGAAHGAISPATVQVAEDGRAKLGGFAGGNLRARLAGTTPDPRDDVAACAVTLVTALVGAPPGIDDTVASARAQRPGVPPELDAVLAGAQSGGIATAGELAARLDGLDLLDDARPNLDGQRTPPLGTPAVRRTSTPPNRNGAVAGVVVGLLLTVAIAVAAFVLFGQGGSNPPPVTGEGPASSTTLGSPGSAYTIVGGHSFDPFGDQTEQEPLIPHLYDGNPSTLWSTEEYTTANFGGLKPGVGAYIVFDATHALHVLTVTSPSRGWVFSVYVARQVSATLAGWGQPVATGITVKGDPTSVELHGATGQAVLVWITDLGPRLANPPQPATPYQVSIGELRVQ